MNMPMNSPKIFRTSDFHLSVVLNSIGYKLIDIDRTSPQRVVFCYQNENTLEQTVKAFFSGELRLDPRLILLNSKLLKDRLYSEQKGGFD